MSNPKSDGLWLVDGSDQSPQAVFLNSLPVDEQKVAALLLTNVQRLTRLCNDFACAVKLTDWIEGFDRDHVAPTEVLHNCKEIAARDAVMTIYHVGVALPAIRSGCAAVSALRSLTPSMQTISSEFNAHWPEGSRSNMRNAVGHRAERTKSIQSFKAHADGAGRQIIGRLVGRTFQITGKGKHYSLDINFETLKNLNHIVKSVVDLFPMLQPKLSRNTPIAF